MRISVRTPVRKATIKKTLIVSFAGMRRDTQKNRTCSQNIVFITDNVKK